MKKNIGTFDRLIRLLLGIIFLILTFFISSVLFKIIFILFGIFCIAEALLSRCVLYALMGKNTCPLE